MLLNALQGTGQQPQQRIADHNFLSEMSCSNRVILLFCKALICEFAHVRNSKKNLKIF